MKQKDLLKQAISFSKAGFKIFKCTGKIPAVKWRESPFIEADEVKEYLSNWTGNYGIAPDKNQLVIDIDPRNFAEDDQPHRRLFKLMGVNPLHYSTTVQTGGGGLHVYLSLPDLSEGVKVRKHHPDFVGIDFISEGSYVVGPGSIHPETNRPYVMLDNYPWPDEMKEAPQELIDLITKEIDYTPNPGLDDASDDQQAILRYQDYLRRADPAVEGAQGDHHTYIIACKGRDYGLSESKTLELLLDEWNVKCVPEWPAEELKSKVHNAYKYAENQLGKDRPESDFEPVHGEVLEKHPGWRGWDRDDRGKLTRTTNNAMNFFICQHENPNSPLINSISFDEFSYEIIKNRWMPWDTKLSKRFPSEGVEWTDADSISYRLWLSTYKRFNLGLTDIEHAITRAARFRTRHPIKDYLNELEWDGKDRLEHWLINNSGAEDNRINRALSRVILMQAVARIYNPSCQADIIVILEGAQGIGKSRLVRALGGEYYADIHVDPNNKDTADAMKGKWIIEMSEMRVLRTKDNDSLKSFITKTTDRYRPAYARRTIDLPRQSTFIGTYNPDATGEYFSDPTGNRRFAPVDCGGEKIDDEAIRKLRDQLFAEATHRLLSGEPWHITDERVQGALEVEQKKRLTTDPLSSPIIDYIEKNRPHHVATEDMWTVVLKGSVRDFSIIYQRRIAGVLRNLGYVRKSRKIKGKTRNVYVNEKYRMNEEIRGLLEDE